MTCLRSNDAVTEIIVVGNQQGKKSVPNGQSTLVQDTNVLFQTIFIKASVIMENLSGC